MSKTHAVRPYKIANKGMKYEFLVESYASERVKVLSVWSEFKDGDLTVRPIRPIPADAACTSRWCINA